MTDMRVMTCADYAAVYDLWIHTPGMGLNDIDDSEDGIRRYLARNPETCFVAVDSGTIVGVILSGHDGRRGFIHHTAVCVSSRHQGIGRRLVTCALAALKQQGITKVALVVFTNNSSGNTFWESCGFTPRSDLVYRNKRIIDL